MFLRSIFSLKLLSDFILIPIRYVWNKQQFEAVNVNKTDYLMGLFQPFAMSYDQLRPKGPTGEPSLREMTSKVSSVSGLVILKQLIPIKYKRV